MMGAGFVIFIKLFLAGIYAIIFAVLSLLALSAHRKKQAWLKWLAGIPAGAMVILGIFSGVIFVRGIIDAMNPRSVFEKSFGEAPSDAVADLKSETYWFADTGSIYLRFMTNEHEFRRLVPSRLELRTTTEMQENTPHEIGSEPPPWWSYRIDNDWIYYLRENTDRGSTGKSGFAGEMEYFAFDPMEEYAYYKFLGID